jgi:S1-C subfamily serine protease
LAKQKNLAIEYKKQAIRLFISQKEYEKAQTSILILQKNAPEIKPDTVTYKMPKEEGDLNKKSPPDSKSQIKKQETPSSSVDGDDSVPYSKAIIDQKRIKPTPETQSLDTINNFNKFPFDKGTPVTGGSGIVIDGGRKVITNRHVIEGGKDFAIKNGLGNMSKAKVIFVSKTDDIAILELTDPFSPENSINDYQFQKARAGSDVVVMGYPLWYVLGTSTPSITNGVVAKGTGVNEDPTNFQLTAKVNKGNSGGPVFDMYGNLIGITQGKLDSEIIKRGDGYAPEDINFAIHIERIAKILNFKKNDSANANKSNPMKPEDLYQTMIGKVVMVAVAID